MVDVAELRELIVAEQERFGVPGLALAVVKDGEVLLCEGFGLRDIEHVEPVTADTHFPIASDSKAFTAAVLCHLADQGTLDLDQPVRELVSWFQMYDPTATALVSTRDLLSHRTGLPRHDFVWYGRPDVTNESVVRALRHLQPNKQLRQTWQYNNLCYMTAGYLTEVLTGKTWGQAIHDQLLNPLAMTATVLNPHDPSIKELAQPYKDVKGTPVLQAFPEKNEEAGAAGGIVSTASDIARWLLARLGGSPEVLSADALAQLHGPAMIGGTVATTFPERQPIGYALGCQNESYRGHRLVRHGGNLVGFSSDVSVLPSAGIGIAILTNLHGTSLRDALPLMIYDRLLGLEPVAWGERYYEQMSALLKGRDDALEHHAAEPAGTPSSRSLDEYAGTYEHPAYGTFGVTHDGERLIPDFHGLGDLHRLDHRNQDGFDLFLVEFDTNVPLTFTQDSTGAIDGLTAGLEPLVPPVRFTRLTPAPEAGLVEAMVGTYSLGPHKVVVRTRGDELVATVPNAGSLPLVSRGGRRFTSPAMPAISVEAQRDGSGVVTALVIEPIGIFARHTDPA